MIYDYFLKDCIDNGLKEYKDWDKEQEYLQNGENKKKKWKKMSYNEKHQQWLNDVFYSPLSSSKRKFYKELIKEFNKENRFNDFYPTLEDFYALPKDSVFINISFSLKKPYTSKGEGEFNIIEDNDANKNDTNKNDTNKNKIFNNPIVRDKLTGFPFVRTSTWKGNLRFAAERVEWEDKDKSEIINRLFGSSKDEEKLVKGRLYFYPTFFNRDATKDVITPLDRKTRTPVKGRSPITLEVIETGTNGDFYLLYFPYPKDNDFFETQVDKDLDFLVESLKLMFYSLGFSAKKTSGFGVINDLKEDNIKVYPEDKKEVFLTLIHSQSNNV